MQAQNGRSFDFNAYKKRHVLLHISYAGWNLHGFAVQEITGKTVESELFKALTRTKLIEARETSNYHRCGRTDKGVSAFHQVSTSESTLMSIFHSFDFQSLNQFSRFPIHGQVRGIWTYHLKKAQYHEGPLFLRPHCGQTSEHTSYSKVSNERYVHYLSNDTP